MSSQPVTDPAILTSWAAQAEARARKIQAASQSTNTPSTIPPTDTEFNAFLAAHSITPTVQTQTQPTNVHRSGTPPYPTGSPALSDTPGPSPVHSNQFPSSPGPLTESVEYNPSLHSLRPSPLNDIQSPLGVSHTRALAEHELTRERMEVQLAKHQAFLDSLTPSATVTSANRPVSTPDNNNVRHQQPSHQQPPSSSLNLSHGHTPVWRHHAMNSVHPPVPSPPSSTANKISPHPLGSYAPQQNSISHYHPLPAPQVDRNQMNHPHSSQREGQVEERDHVQYHHGRTGSPPRLHTNQHQQHHHQYHQQLHQHRSPSPHDQMNHSTHSRNRSADLNSTPRSTNSFGYEEMALTDNVFLLAEKNRGSRHGSLRNSTTASPVHHANRLSMGYEKEHTYDEDQDANEQDSSVASEPRGLAQSHSHIQSHPSRQPQVSAFFPNSTGQQRVGRGTSAASAQVQAHSPSSYQPQRATSKPTGSLQSDHWGPDLFALAHVGLNLSELDSQRAMVEEHSRPKGKFTRDTTQSRHDEREEGEHKQQSAQSQQQPSQSRRPATATTAATNKSSGAASTSTTKSALSNSHKKSVAPPSAKSSHGEKKIPNPPSHGSTASSTVSSKHPSTKLAPAYLHDPVLTSETNFRLTQQVHADQYAPITNTAIAQPYEKERKIGWTPADSAAALAKRAKAVSAASNTGSSTVAASVVETKPKPALDTGAVRKPVHTAASTSASAHPAKVPVLSVTSGPVPVVVGLAARDSTAVPVHHKRSGSGAAFYPKAKPLPQVEYSPVTRAYSAKLAHDDSEPVSPVRSEGAGAANGDDDSHDLDDQDLVSDEHEQFTPERPRQSVVTSSSPSALEEHAVEAQLSALSSVLERKQELQHAHANPSPLERKLLDEIATLREATGYQDLFDSYESTISQLQKQVSSLRLKAQRAELHPEVLSQIRSPSHGRKHVLSGQDDEEPASVKQAHFRVLENSYRKLQEEHAALQSSYANLQKQARRFTLQNKQCVTLQARVQEHVNLMRAKDRDIATTKKILDAAQQEIEGLKDLVFEMTQKNNHEHEKNAKLQDQLTKQKKEIETLTQALFDSRSANILAQIKPKNAVIKRTTQPKFIEKCSELDEIEHLFLEGRKSDTPPNLVTLANRKGLDLCNRLRTQIDLLDRAGASTSENEKALLLLVMKLQEKNEIVRKRVKLIHAIPSTTSTGAR